MTATGPWYVQEEGALLVPLEDAFEAEAFFAQALGYACWDSYVEALHTARGREEIAARIQRKMEARGI